MPQRLQQVFYKIREHILATTIIPKAYKELTRIFIAKDPSGRRPISLGFDEMAIISGMVYAWGRDAAVSIGGLHPTIWAYVPNRGCPAPIMLMRATLEDAKEYKKPLQLFCMDMAKLFDSPALDVIQAGAHAAGAPRASGEFGQLPGIQDMIAEYLHERTVTVKTEHGYTDAAFMEAGFAQGDSLSCLMCNFVISPLLCQDSSRVGRIMSLKIVNSFQWSLLKFKRRNSPDSSVCIIEL